MRLIFYSFEPYPYPYPYSYAYPIILTLKIYQSVVLKIVQLFPLFFCAVLGGLSSTPPGYCRNSSTENNQKYNLM